MDSLGGGNESVPIIDSKFCMPDTMQLIVKPIKKIFRELSYIVLDTDGNQLLKLAKDDSLMSKYRILLDATGSPIATLRRKRFSWHDVWRVYRGKNTNDKDGLFRVMRKNGVTLKVFMGSESSKDDNNKKSDLDINVRFPLTFYMGDTMIADVSDNFSGGEDGMEKGIKIRVSAGIDYAFIICLILIFGDLMAEANEASDGGGGWKDHGGGDGTGGGGGSGYDGGNGDGGGVGGGGGGGCGGVGGGGGGTGCGGGGYGGGGTGCGGGGYGGGGTGCGGGGGGGFGGGGW